MAKHYYEATWFDASGAYKRCSFSGKAAALKHGEAIAALQSALVRVATPAGNLVKYFDGRKVAA